MADQPDALATHTAVDDRAVLSTKLHIPRPPPTFVARSRLTERLDDAGPGTVVLVCAPAGCGKSVLVSDWCRRRELSTAWLSLDSDDNDPIRFWRHVAASLDRARRDQSSTLRIDVDRLIRRSSDPPLAEVATTVANRIDDAFDDVVLVLDDYHLIDDGDVHAGVRLLLEHAPAQLRVAVISRADPPLLLARRRARGELTEIRAADLRFSAAEAASFLDGATGGHLSEHAVSTLTDRTEGWAVGLQLAALSLDGRDDISTFLTTFSGSHRFVLDYLTEEVLDRQPAPVREFLLSTSILERLSGPLCDAVTGDNDGQELLEACERANLFVVPLDDERRWWRYHHLFAELLRARLDRRPRDLARDLHRRAAGWHEAHGLIDQAIDHATAAGDPAWAMRLIERHADELLLQREGATLRRKLADLGDGAEASRRLLVAHARTAAYAGRPSEVETLLDAAATASTDPDEQFEPSIDRVASPLATLDPTIALLRAFVAHLRGNCDDAVTLAKQTLSSLDDDRSAVALIAQLHLATAPWLRGAVTEAEPALEANIDRWRTLGEPDRAAFGCHYLARARSAPAAISMLRSRPTAGCCRSRRAALRRGRRPPVSPTSDWPRWHTCVATSNKRADTSRLASRRAGISSTPRRCHRVSPRWRGSVVQKETPTQRASHSTKRSTSAPTPTSSTSSIPSRSSAHSSCSPTATTVPPSDGRSTVASAQRTSRTTRSSPLTYSSRDS